MKGNVKPCRTIRINKQDLDLIIDICKDKVSVSAMLCKIIHDYCENIRKAIRENQQ